MKTAKELFDAHWALYWKDPMNNYAERNESWRLFLEAAAKEGLLNRRSFFKDSGKPEPRGFNDELYKEGLRTGSMESWEWGE